MSKSLINNLSLIIPSRDDDLRIYQNIEFIIEYLIKNVDEYEIVVVSNGSTEMSMKNIDQLCMQYNNLKHFKLSKGIGIKFILPPLGPIRLDFGITEEGIGRLQVNLGHSF